MEVSKDFYISGFTRYDMKKDGALFLRYEVQQTDEDEAKPEIRRSEHHNGTYKIGYLVMIPRPKPARVAAFAAVTRPSKNNYTAIAGSVTAGKMRLFKGDTLEELRRELNMYFSDLFFTEG